MRAPVFIENSNECVCVCVVIAEKLCVNDVDMAGSLRADVWVPSCIFTSSLIIQQIFCIL